MQLHTIKRKTKNKISRQVGRGGTRGKTSGRGTKGQNARAGRKKRPEIRDTIKALPKLRGRGVNLNTSIKDKPTIINLEDLSAFSAGETVSPETLVEKGVLKKEKGRFPHVKILGTGDVSSALKISMCQVSESAKEKIAKAGGSIL